MGKKDEDPPKTTAQETTSTGAIPKTTVTTTTTSTGTNPTPSVTDSSTSRAAQIQELNQRIRSHKRKLRAYGDNLSSIYEKGRKALRDPNEIDGFRGMHSSAAGYFEKIENIWYELYDLYDAAGRSSEFPNSVEVDWEKKIRKYFYDSNADMVTINRCNPLNTNPTLSGVSAHELTVSSISHGATHLPKISLPPFDGLILSWPKFKDAFVSMVHNETSISPIHKFHFLIRAVSGPAHAIVSKLPLVSDNYEVVWKNLCDAYDNQRLLASAYLNELLNFKPLSNKPSVAAYQQFLSRVAENISAFGKIKIPDKAGFILFHIATKCLDPVTREQFEIHQNDEFPNFDNLSKFIRDRCLALQLSDHTQVSNSDVSAQSNETKSSPKGSKGKSKPKSTTLLGTSKPNEGEFKSKSTPSNQRGNSDNQSKPICFVCKQSSHKLLDCLKFTEASNQQRNNWLKNWHGCMNCLNESHTMSTCRSKWHCRFCPEKHHAMLHMNSTSNHHSDNNSSSSQTSSALHTISAQGSKILLGTILAEIEDSYGNYQQIRIVADSGSQNSFITTKCLRKLGLNMLKLPKKIACLGNTLFDGIKGQVTCKIRPRHSNSPTFVTDAMVVQTITCDQPNIPLRTEEWEAYTTYHLADDKFWETNPIDFLMGCDLTPEIWTGNIVTLSEHHPKLFSSVFGYVVCGKIDNENELFNPTVLFTADAPDLRDELQKFWEMEEPSPRGKFTDPDDDFCEDHFIKTHYRDESGRFVVSLPFKESNPQFGPSSSHAMVRLTNQERKLQRNADLRAQYTDFMKEYIEMGHMYPTNSPAKYIIPHHSVTKEDRNITKLRVVFDASATTSHGSLNEKLMTGPKLQTDIKDILMTWRVHKVVLVADLVKMYRGILLNPNDRCYQHILWRFNAADPVQEYELATLTYGLSSSPYLALRVIQELQKTEGHHFPLAARTIPNDMYIDDWVSGADSKEEALRLQREVISLFAKGGFTLSKWASNDPDLLKDVSGESENELHFSEKEEGSNIKILGLRWNSKDDAFSYTISSPPLVYTKRSLYSSISKIYDPLGFLSPTILIAKSFIQELWKAQLGWDDPLPTQIKQKWCDFIHQLPKLSAISIPRLLSAVKPLRYQIVGFCDASEKGYGASIYIRILEENNITSKLVISKTKLASLQTQTIPRLELCGALLLAELYTSLTKFFEALPQPEIIPCFFTDSTTVLSWLNTPVHKLKIYVANRVNQILTLISREKWMHVSTNENPSDCCSRGLMPEELINHSLWWHGPNWLQQPMQDWPQSTPTLLKEIPECKPNELEISQVLLVNNEPSTDLNWFKYYSSYPKLIRFVGTLRRFIHNSKNKTNQKYGPLTALEFRNAELCCIKMVQLKILFDGDIPKNKEKIFHRNRKLSPYFDTLSILRVGGRLRNAKLSENSKHPILLPNSCHFTVLMVDYYHLLYLHPGPGLLQALIQLKFWVHSLRQLVRHRTFMCITCYKERKANESKPPIMGDLPECRVAAGRVFQHIGIDLGGPFAIKESQRRKAALGKAYVTLFICMQTKALHLEVVSSLSTEAFFAALTRFIAKHGTPQAIYTDCGSNFIGAWNYLKEVKQWFEDEKTKDALLQHCSPLNIEWHFNPPRAPHFGGLWEAGIKSVKGHLKRVIGDTPLTFEELDTFFKQTEAILNSRPLCPLSNSPEEMDYLTPAHFLIGGSLMINPEPTLLDVRENRLSRWQLVKQKTEHLWRRWKTEYLSTLQEKVKWTEEKEPTIRVGSLVLIKDVTPVAHWPKGIVTDLHPGKDGITRVATVKTQNNTFRRLLINLVPLLPLEHHPFGTQ